jgi:hypothetical protein
MKKNTLKWGILALALVFALILAGCGNTIDQQTISTTLVGNAYSFLNRSSYDVAIRISGEAGELGVATASVSNVKSFTLKAGEAAAFTNGPKTVTFSGSATGPVKVEKNDLLGTVTFSDDSN